jgi:hypothetical protein
MFGSKLMIEDVPTSAHCVHPFLWTPRPALPRATVQPNASADPEGQACTGASVTVLTLALRLVTLYYLKSFCRKPSHCVAIGGEPARLLRSVGV